MVNILSGCLTNYMVTPNSQLGGYVRCAETCCPTVLQQVLYVVTPPDHAHAVTYRRLTQHALLSISAVIPTVGKPAPGSKRTHTAAKVTPRWADNKRPTNQPLTC
jgi:hypothetical protein